MVHSKGTMGTTQLIGIILVLFFIGISLASYASIRKEAEFFEHARCRVSLELAHGLPSPDIETGIGNYELAIRAAPVECAPIRLSDQNFTDLTEDDDLAARLTEKMRVAWWATGAGRIRNVWFDSGWTWKWNEDNPLQVCKPLYLFTFSENFEEELPTKLELVDAIDHKKLPSIKRTLREYVEVSNALEKSYYVVLPTGKIEPKVTYAIFVSSSKAHQSKLIFASMTQDPIKYRETPASSEITLCDDHFPEGTNYE